MSLQLNPTLRHRLTAADRSLFGAWVCSGSPIMAEIIAGAGFDWLLIDMEHAPNGLESTLAQLHAISAYQVTPVVRVSSGDLVRIKQVLDLGAQTLIVPMISTPEEASAVVEATQYPPAGSRGVGSALARSARWGRIEGYLQNATEQVSVFVQIETTEGVDNAEAIAATEGIDGVFVGPGDLAASMGFLGNQSHPDVVATVHRVFDAVLAVGKHVGVNAFDPAAAHAYRDAGANFVLVGADVALAARAAEALVDTFTQEKCGCAPAAD